MLDSEKVDQFYNFLKTQYYNWLEPEKIILISPNHYNTQANEIKTICESKNISYKSESINLDSKLHSLWIKCDENWEIFYLWGNNLQTKEHWIWEHFHRINKYFPNSKVLPIITPCFQFSAVEDVLQIINSLDWNILVIASVDFAHYQNEKQTLQHDKKSIEVLEDMIIDYTKFIDWIDADCPSCLYFIQYLANKQWKKAKLRYRDSSSTILSQDMWKENTSRVFMRYK